MKNIVYLVSLSFALTMMACSDKSAEVKKEVIVVPSKVLVKDPPEKTTTIVVDKNGVKVVAKKVDVIVKKQ